MEYSADYMHGDVFSIFYAISSKRRSVLGFSFERVLWDDLKISYMWSPFLVKTFMLSPIKACTLSFVAVPLVYCCTLSPLPAVHPLVDWSLHVVVGVVAITLAVMRHVCCLLEEVETV